jgi:uncharacterized phage infection (PIP) family protein YhgE
MLHTGSSREEGMAAVLFRWLSQFLMNLSLGLLSAVFWFAVRVSSLVFAYQPPMLTGLGFVAVAVVGAAGTAVLFMALLYAAAVGGVLLVARQAASARIEAQRQAQLRGEAPHAGAGPRGAPFGRRPPQTFDE